MKHISFEEELNFNIREVNRKKQMLQIEINKGHKAIK